MDPWFGPKDRYDGGIASWRGGLATIIFLGVLFSADFLFRPADFGWPAWSRTALILALSASFLVLVWAKYDRDPS